MKTHFEAIAGIGLAGTGIVVSKFNEIVGSAVLLSTLIVWLIKLRKEWIHRNDPPKDD